MPDEQTLTAALAAVTVFWVFAVAACLGSFLNVLVWRLGRGEAITGSSHCPRCGTDILLRDNVPVFGWMLLRGRCRACGLPISPRYPLVEGFLALLAVGLLFAETLTGGANLPHRPPDGYAGVVWTIWSFRSPELLASLGHHFLLLYLLTFLALTEWDGSPVSPAMVATCLGTAVLTAVLAPGVQPVHWDQAALGDAWVTSPSAAVQTATLGMIAGMALGLVPARIGGPAAWASVVAVGAFLGWQAAVHVAVASWILLTVIVSALDQRRPKPHPLPVSGFVGVATGGYLLLWRWLVG